MPQFARDGKRIAFESTRLGAGSQLWTANADGTNMSPLTEPHNTIVGSLSWSPDGRSIVFDGQPAEGGRANVFVIDSAGGQEHRLTTGGMPSWSHDGQWVYFTSRGNVWRIRPSGGEQQQVTDRGGVGSVMESPDGKTLYYLKVKELGSRTQALFSRPTAGGPERQVLNTAFPGPWHAFFPVDDGVYYLTIPDAARPFANELRLRNVVTGKDEVVSHFEARFSFGLAVSPDRKTMLFSVLK